MSNGEPSQLPSCDLVMKGGITSGVVYPKLIARLADEYQFRSVGGTSAGAIAAAGCAAAEHGRQRGTNLNAFAELAKLPDQLGNPVGTGAGSMLFQLFRPAPALRDHFAVLVGALNRRDKIAAVGGALRSLLLKFWPLSLLALLAAVVVGAPLLKSIAPQLEAGPAIGWALAIVAIWLAWLGLATMLRKILTLKGAVALWLLASIASTTALLWLVTNWGGKMFLLVTAAFAVAMPLCLALAVALCVTRFTVTLLAGLHGNRWGLCSGHDDIADGPQPPLTDWLTGYFNTLAGMDPKGRPLTFGDLWGAPMEAIEADAANTPARDRRLDLQVMTTAVSQKMCYAIPFREGAGQFYYDRAEWAALFPPSVMAWLDQVSAVADAGQDAVTRAGGVSLRRLPSGRYLPVVVAVRLSLSFPVLLSALPLYQIDYSMPDDVKNKRATRVWFSDGGLSSNMPLHFFDAALPGRPTFAINLKDEHPAHRIDPDKKACAQEGRVYLAGNNNAGRIQHWPPPNDGTPMGLFDFLFGIVDTMQNWRDEIQFPYPGYRDRIVQISQLPDEGGLNLNMPKPQIDALSDAGDCAAVTLIHRFLSSPTSTADGWENHRDIRMRTFLALMEDLVTGASLHDPAWNAVIQDAVVRKHYSNDQALVAQTLLNGLRGMGTAVTNGGTSLVPPPAAPRPRPQMIIAPYI